MANQDWQQNKKDPHFTPPVRNRRWTIHRIRKDWRRSPKTVPDRFHWDSRWHHWHHRRIHWPGVGKRKRGLFFLRFLAAFGMIVLLVLGGMGAFAYLLSQFFDGGGRMAALVWILGCSLSLALPLLAAALAFSIFRGVATPLADIMAAAEAVAQGDLDVRVPIPSNSPRDFRRLAESFNEMINALARLDQQRRNLTADVAHELRTPLHIIQGNLEGILDGVYQPTPEQINALLDETRTLTRLVQDLGILSLADADQLTLNLEQVDLWELLDDIRTSFSGQAESTHIDLQVEFAEQIQGVEGTTSAQPSSLVIQADPARLGQVLTNLVTNALQHTGEDGRITLRAGFNPTGVTIQVVDTGQGIPEADLPFIFDRFWKGDRSRGRTSGAGSGLGLAISRKLVEAHGGYISVESKVGLGTTFTIELPNPK